MPKNMGQQVVRDYIPEGDAPTATEAALRSTARARVQQGIIRDFIPAEGHTLAKGVGKDAADQALQRALKAQEFAARADYDDAVNRLQKLNVADAVALIAKLPLAQQELFLAAEAAHGNRKSLLSQFPDVDPKVVEKYAAIVAASTVDEKEDN